VYDHIHGLGEQLREGLADIVADQPPRYTVTGTDGMFKLVFTRDGPADFDGHCEGGCAQRESCPRFEHCPKTGADVANGETDRWRRVFYPKMREQGVLLSQNQYESQFVTDSHTEEDVEETLEAYKEAL
jgi:glutamate-1-semialdehyde 2,1-aminomutase